MKFPAMFSPIRIGTVTVPNRFVVPPMGNNFANTDGSLSDRSLGYYRARAKGGFGLITIESTVVYQEAKGGPRKPCLFSDDTVESFRRVADACHAYGAKVSLQLQHAGPEGSAALTGFPLKAASAMPAAAGRDIPEAVSNEEIYRIIECYGDAARRAQQAGIDMVEVHCAHGYLVSTFISQRTNHRTDEFGGCFENRMRLPRLIIENIRRKTGGNLPILCRINASDEVEGGQSVQNAAAVANRDFQQKTETARQKLSAAEEAMKDYVAQSLALCRTQMQFLEQLPHSDLPAQESAEAQETVPAAQAAPAEEAASSEEAAPAQETVPAEEPAQADEPRDAAPTQDTVRIIGKDILSAYEKQQAPEPDHTLHPDTDFVSEFKLDLDELKFGRNYDPEKN